MKPKNGYVYAIFDCERGITKIGRAANAKSRIASIVTQGGIKEYKSFFVETGDYYGVELLCHAKLHDKRIQGTEWFYVTIEAAESCIKSFAVQTKDASCDVRDFHFSIVEKNGELKKLIDSIELANILEQKHRTVLEMIDKYADSFEKLGSVCFLYSEPVSLPQGGHAKKTRYAMLNEDHCLFLLSLMKNSEHMVNAKLKFIKHFSQCLAQISPMQ